MTEVRWLRSLARAARELLDVYDNKPELFAEVMKFFAAQNIDILHELAKLDRFTCPRCCFVSHNPNDAENRYCGRCHVFVDDC
jgi:hypothetical protein